MSYLVFARKYRPQTFEQVVGQGHVTRTLSHAVESGRLAHAILFTGPRGTGKTTIARILAKCMNCYQGSSALPCNQCQSCGEVTAGNSADVFEIDGASNNSVDQVRELRDNLKYMPSHSRYKVYIIDEVHMLSTAAFNALLKTLEEPPAHILFIFATTEPHKIPLTILSRCQRHDLRRIETDAIVRHLHSICALEKVAVDDESLTMIAREAGGSVRDALSLLDHIVSCADGTVTVEFITDLLGLVERRHLHDCADAVFKQDIARLLTRIDEVWRQGYEIKRFYSDLLIYFHQLTMVKMGRQTARLVDVPVHEIQQLEQQAVDIADSRLLQIFDFLFQIEPSIRLSSQPKMALEIAFMKLFQIPPALAIETLIERLDRLRDSLLSDGIRPAPDADLTGKEANWTPGVPSGGDRIPVEPAGDALAEMDASVSPGNASLWERAMAEVACTKPSLAASLKKCRLVIKADDQMDVEVNGTDFVLKSITKQAAFLEELLSDLTNHKVRLNIVANIEELRLKHEQKQMAEDLKQKALGHPMVMEALVLFDGKVIDVKLSDEKSS
jgi:DNA polymerase III subunit gamma/tau